jgi:hypothetical protein
MLSNPGNEVDILSQTFAKSSVFAKFGRAVTHARHSRRFLLAQSWILFKISRSRFNNSSSHLKAHTT